MKKFNSMFLVAMAAFSASAATTSYQITTSQESDIPTFKQVAMQSALNRRNAPAMKASDGIITEVPEGKTGVYTVEAYSFYVAMGSYVGFEKISMARQATITEDAIYLDGLGAYNQGTFIKADKRDDNTYVISLPCPIYSQTYMDWEANEEVTVNYELRMMDAVYNEEGKISSYIPTDETEVELYYEDGVISLELGYVPEMDSTGQITNYPERILGVCVEENGNWAGYGDAGFDWIPFDQEVATPPSDMKVENWVLATDGQGNMIHIGFSGDEVWIGDLVPTQLPDVWVKGTIVDDKVVVESGQYMGIIWEAFVYFVSATVDHAGYSHVVDAYEFDYDPIAKTIKANNPDMLIAVSAAPDKVIDWTKWYNPSFTYQPEEIDLIPQTPFDLCYDDWFADYGYAVFTFDESNLNAYGHLLDTSNMYYRIYFDDELVEFSEELSESYGYDFSEPTSEIPLNYSGSNFWWWDITHQVMLYLDGISTVGVQVINKVANEIYSSPIVTLDIENGDITVGVDSLTNNGEVSKVEYYNLNGTKVQNPENGIYIRKTIMTDGSSVTSKVIVK